MSFEIEDSTLSFIPGLAFVCKVDFPFSEQFDATAHVRRVTLSKQKGCFIVHCEFERLADGAATTVTRYAIRFGPANETKSLIRSQSIRGNLSDLVSFDSHVHKVAYEIIRRDLGPTDGHMLEPDQPESTRVVAHLGTLPIATIRLDLRGTSSKRELRVSDLVIRSELRGSGLIAILSAFVADAYHRFGADALSLCDDANDVFPRKISRKLKRRSKDYLGSGNVFNNPVSWGDYAAAYDVMCDANPAYAANLSLFSSWLRNLDLPSSARICDVGAGTGNYILDAAKQLPEAEILHLERDPIMNQLASRKYKNHGVSNVSFVIADINDHTWEENSLDVILVVNALYSLPDPRHVLQKLYAGLKSGGHLFTIDLGRTMDVLDWSRYIAISNIRKHGVLRTLASFYRARRAITQNRAIRNAQERGEFWKHSSAEFRNQLEDIGFELISLQSCYRGYCDAAICRKV
jgi:ubiquinone/menaquinone biosynthesis C-methylase UbiE